MKNSSIDALCDTLNLPLEDPTFKIGDIIAIKDRNRGTILSIGGSPVWGVIVQTTRKSLIGEVWWFHGKKISSCILHSKFVETIY